MFDKEALRSLEEKIESLAKEFYSIPKDDENYISKRDSRKMLLITTLHKYYEKIYGKRFVEEYSYEIFTTLENISNRDKNKKIGVLANYSSEKGNFLDYCNRSVKIQIQRFQKENSFDQIDENKNYDEDGIQNDDNFDDITGKLQIIENQFKKKQERIKPYLSALLTHKCYTLLLKITDDDFNRLSFIDKKLFKKILENPKLKQQEVSMKFGRDKTDASRTLRKFFENIKTINNHPLSIIN